jgi:hypothetical protein
MMTTRVIGDWITTPVVVFAIGSGGVGGVRNRRRGRESVWQVSLISTRWDEALERLRAHVEEEES